MADGARLRAAGLAEMLKLKRTRMPHAVTYSGCWARRSSLSSLNAR
jgi:hypothetical protein